MEQRFLRQEFVPFYKLFFNHSSTGSSLTKTLILLTIHCRQRSGMPIDPRPRSAGNSPRFYSALR